MEEPTQILNEDSSEEAHLIGRLLDGTPVYWGVADSTVIVLDDGIQEEVEVQEETVEEYVLEREYTDPEGWKNLTVLGDFLRQTAPYRGVGGFDGKRLISHRQAEAYALRELLGMSRSRAAELMGISKNTLDEHYQRAQARIGQALGIAGAVREHQTEGSDGLLQSMLEDIQPDASDVPITEDEPVIARFLPSQPTVQIGEQECVMPDEKYIYTSCDDCGKSGYVPQPSDELAHLARRPLICKTCGDNDE